MFGPKVLTAKQGPAPVINSVYILKVPYALAKGESWTYFVEDAGDECAAIAKWTQKPSNPALSSPRIKPSGPLSGTGESGSGVGSKGPHK